MTRTWLLMIFLLAIGGPSHAAIIEHFAQPEQAAQYERINKQLRCLVCQNQSLADSHAQLAEDLKLIVAQKVKAGYNDAEIIDFFVARYGDFVRYRPPVNHMTLLLWFGPIAFLLLASVAFVMIIRFRRGHH